MTRNRFGTLFTFGIDGDCEHLNGVNPLLEFGIFGITFNTSYSIFLRISINENISDLKSTGFPEHTVFKISIGFLFANN